MLSLRDTLARAEPIWQLIRPALELICVINVEQLVDAMPCDSMKKTNKVSRTLPGPLLQKWAAPRPIVNLVAALLESFGEQREVAKRSAKEH